MNHLIAVTAVAGGVVVGLLAVGCFVRWADRASAEVIARHREGI